MPFQTGRFRRLQSTSAWSIWRSFLVQRRARSARSWEARVSRLIGKFDTTADSSNWQVTFRESRIPIVRDAFEARRHLFAGLAFICRRRPRNYKAPSRFGMALWLAQVTGLSELSCSSPAGSRFVGGKLFPGVCVLLAARNSHSCSLLHHWRSSNSTSRANCGSLSFQRLEADPPFGGCAFWKLFRP
jgi:hypothetical protein